MLPGSRRVTLVKSFGGPSEARQQVSGNVQPDKGFFGLNTPIEVGDVIEAPDPRSGSIEPLRYWVAKLDIFDVGHRGHIEATWGSQPAAAAPRPTSTLDLSGLHKHVAAAAAPLYRDGHYAPAVFQAFKAVEIRLRELSGLDLSGRDLAAQALGTDNPRVLVSRHIGRTGADEQEGFRLLFMGALQGLRNPGGHELDKLDGQEALEQMAVASLLMRWLDTARRNDPTGMSDDPAGRPARPPRETINRRPQRKAADPSPSARLVVLRELRDVAHRQARTSAILDLQIRPLSDASGFSADRLQDALVDLLAEGLAEPYPGSTEALTDRLG
jgi:uncharacterized protein (TIGR02391 family)